MCLVHQAPQALYIINATKHPFFSSENRLLICPFNAKHGPLTNNTCNFIFEARPRIESKLTDPEG